jgi:phasin
MFVIRLAPRTFYELQIGGTGTLHVAIADRRSTMSGQGARRHIRRSLTMSEAGRFEIPQEMRSMAEASFEQARKTFDKFLASAQAAAGSIEERGATVRAGAKDVSAKAIAFAEKNVQASLDYAQSLLHAKDLPEVMRLHGEYVQAQMRSLAEQASEMSQVVSRAAMDAAKPKV